MARKHASQLLKDPEVEIAGICGTSVEKAAAFGQKLDLAASPFDDFDALLDSVRPDAVVITLPPFAHSGQFERAAESGAAVFIEKPIALTSDRAASMVAAADAASSVTEVGYHLHGHSVIRRIEEAIRSGAAGQVTLFQGRYFANHLHAPWWRDVSKSGGQVLEQAIHLYNLACSFCGSPKAASGFLANLGHQDVEGYSVEDTSVAAVKFDSGALATLSSSNCATPMSWEPKFTLVCENLNVELVPGGAGKWVTVSEGAAEAEEVFDQPEESMMEHFLKVIRGDAEPWVPIHAAARDLELALAVKKSAAEGGSLQQLRP